MYINQQILINNGGAYVTRYSCSTRTVAKRFVRVTAKIKPSMDKLMSECIKQTDGTGVFGGGGARRVDPYLPGS